MTMISLSDALNLALSDKDLIGEAVGAALAREKAAVEVGAKTAVSSLEGLTMKRANRNGVREETLSEVRNMDFLRLVSSRCMDRAKPTRLPRAARSIHLVLVVDNDHARSLSVGAGASKRRVK